jgi:hypothetical protein
MRRDAHLFTPAGAIAVVQGGDNGTPLQKDEPQAENPPTGAVIDYYLRADAVGPVTLEILDASGAVVRTFASDPKAAPPPPARPGRRAGGIPNTSPLWRQPAPAPLPAAAGAHRVVWDLLRGRDAQAAAGADDDAPPRQQLTGTFIARLTVGGRPQVRTFKVRPDPRSGERQAAGPVTPS